MENVCWNTKDVLEKMNGLNDIFFQWYLKIVDH